MQLNEEEEEKEEEKEAEKEDYIRFLRIRIILMQ